jgi:hypothetical protein
VQTYLLDEVLARFHGPARQHWYLSDGGHFENTACYELIRRRLPLIVVLDDGADPAYEFEDLANLVRKVRIDFGAEVEFLDRSGAAAMLRTNAGALGPIGGLNELSGRLGQMPGAAHAVLARVHYHDPVAESLVLFVKPSLTGDEPLDVQQYRSTHATFPQETTADQFFDEAQWESYRCLGQHVADELLAIGPLRVAFQLS